MEHIFTSQWSTPEARFRLRDDGLVFVQLTDGIAIDRGRMEGLLLSALEHLEDDSSYPFIIEVGAFTQLTPEGGQFVQEYEGKNPVQSLCIVSDSLSVRLAANFYQAVFKPNFAFRMFQHLEEAIAWSFQQRV
jgi:hypothetical protein